MSTIMQVIDSSWVTTSLLMKTRREADLRQDPGTFSTASSKFVDTTLGGSLHINPLPQFTHSADIRMPGLVPGSPGLGRYYSEAYDDNAQTIHIRVGVPSFNNMAWFVANFYNSSMGRLARTGSAGGFVYTAAKVAGFVVSVMSWKLQAVRALGKALMFFAKKGTSKFYTLKPAMPMFWNATQSIVNQLAVNMGIVPRVFGESSQAINDGYEYPKESITQLHNSLGGLINSGGSIDVYNIAGKAQRRARAQLDRAEEVFSQSGGNADFALQNLYREPISSLGKNRPYEAYLNQWLGTTISGGSESEIQAGQDIIDVAPVEAMMKEDEGFFNFLKAELDDGSAWVTFRVNATGAGNSSFSNTVGESEIASKLNNMASTARQAAFSFSEGNLVPGLSSIVSGVKSVIDSVSESFGLDGVVNAASGGAFIDIPQTWRGSMANLPESSYTIQLTTPYNNALCHLMYIYTPLAMLLAMTLPLSTGKQSYTSPFILEYYDRGRAQSRLAMVESLSISHGIHSLTHTTDGRALGLEVNLKFVDMTSVVHMPIAMAFNFAKRAMDVVTSMGTSLISESGAFDDDTSYSDYLAVLSGLSLTDQIYILNKLKLRLTKQALDWRKWTSPAHNAMVLGNSLPGRLVSAFFPGTVRQ